MLEWEIGHDFRIIKMPIFVVPRRRLKEIDVSENNQCSTYYITL